MSFEFPNLRPGEKYYSTSPQTDSAVTSRGDEADTHLFLSVNEALSYSVQRPLKPLRITSITTAEQCASISKELQQWWLAAEEIKIKFRATKPYDDENTTGIFLKQVVHYAALVHSISGVFKVQEIYKDAMIFAAYDQDGQLEGTVVAYKEFNSIVVSSLVTAIFNMSFTSSEHPARTRGTGTCLLARCVECLPTDGLLKLASAEESIPFYQRLGFEQSDRYFYFSAVKLPLLLEKVNGQILSEEKMGQSL